MRLMLFEDLRSVNLIHEIICMNLWDVITDDVGIDDNVYMR